MCVQALHNKSTCPEDACVIQQNSSTVDFRLCGIPTVKSVTGMDYALSWRGTHVILVEDGETAGVVLVGDTCGSREALEGEEARPLNCPHEGNAHADGVELEVNFDLLIHQV